MRITHGNTVLRSLTEKDLEMVRSWRNDQLVNEHLLNREYISQEAQLKWFRQLDSDSSLYLIMEEKGQPFGLVYATGINHKDCSYWGNIMLGNSEFRDGHLAVKTVMMLMWYFFSELNFEVCYSKVAVENTSALQLNDRLGFRTVKKDRKVLHQRCEKSMFHNATSQIWKALFARHQISILQSEFNLQ